MLDTGVKVIGRGGLSDPINWLAWAGSMMVNINRIRLSHILGTPEPAEGGPLSPPVEYSLSCGHSKTCGWNYFKMKRSGASKVSPKIAALQVIYPPKNSTFSFRKNFVNGISSGQLTR